MIGRVEMYSPKKRYGFIMGDDGIKYFVHQSNVKTVSGSISEGYAVTFSRGDGNRALNVKLL